MTTTLQVEICERDHARAREFVMDHLRRLGRRPTSLEPWSVITTVLFCVPLFVIETAPNSLDSHTKSLLRLAVLSLLAVPPLFAFGVFRLRKADARALAPLAPATAERVDFAADDCLLSIEIGTVRVSAGWEEASVLVVDDAFAVVLVPRVSPIPLPREGCSSAEQFFLFLRQAQQYRAAFTAALAK